ncbi:hypothetical protein HPB49_017033 [Dermacentor silvarum]|uniref:Uncharacterized protein n=1 Tax=Dermacentor silvarum TaxID=543639 RepID=A0ACB8DEV9_DERSI|nr:hypothetical protein HPB49_017033 [Dermacentor silvarum]
MVPTYCFVEATASDDKRVTSTPKEELAERIRRITALQLGGKEYQVYAHVAAPDMSCKGVATGIDSETHPDELMADLRSPQASILFVRMLGKSTADLITFDGLEVQEQFIIMVENSYVDPTDRYLRYAAYA